MIRVTKSFVFAITMLISIVPAQAAYSESVYERWQIKRLFKPSDSQLKMEQKGKVFIYEGIKDIDVNRILEEQFDRVDSMMFIGTVITTDDGRPKKNPETGLVMREDDDC